jgi:hypothetical protein
MILFGLGGGFSLYEGIAHLDHLAEMEGRVKDVDSRLTRVLVEPASAADGPART